MRIVVILGVLLLIGVAQAQYEDPGLKNRVLRLERQVESLESRLDSVESRVGRSGSPTSTLLAPARWQNPANWEFLEVGMGFKEVRDILGLPDAGLRADGTMTWIYGGETANVHPHVVLDATPIR
jgi:hypothetical protein